MYFFSVTVAAFGKGQNAHPVLFKNGIEIGRTVSGSTASDWCETASITKITHLEKNDQVYVKQIELPGHTANLYGKGFTSFAGGLMYSI